MKFSVTCNTTVSTKISTETFTFGDDLENAP